MSEIQYSATAVKNRAQGIVATFHVAWERYDNIDDVKKLLIDAVDDLVQRRAADPAFRKKKRVAVVEQSDRYCMEHDSTYCNCPDTGPLVVS